MNEEPGKMRVCGERKEIPVECPWSCMLMSIVEYYIYKHLLIFLRGRGLMRSSWRANEGEVVEKSGHEGAWKDSEDVHTREREEWKKEETVGRRKKQEYMKREKQAVQAVMVSPSVSTNIQTENTPLLDPVPAQEKKQKERKGKKRVRSSKEEDKEGVQERREWGGRDKGQHKR